MRLWWVVVLAVVGVLLQAGAVAYYLTEMPPRLAEDYAERAEREHERLARAVGPATETFDDVTLGTLDIDDDLSPRAYLRRFKRVTRQDRREHARAERRVKRAKRALARADTEAMTEVPDWPLLGGRGELGEAEDAAERLDAYMRKARAFVRDYGLLLDYWGTTSRMGERVVVALTEAYAKIPRYIASPRQFTGPMGRALGVAEAQLKRLRRLDPPKALRADHRRSLAGLRRNIADQRAMSAAVRRSDFAGANRIRASLRRRAKAEDRRGRRELQRLVGSSRYRRQINDLLRREIAVSGALDRI